LPIAYCLLPIAHCPLPIAHCPFYLIPLPAKADTVLLEVFYG